MQHKMQPPPDVDTWSNYSQPGGNKARSVIRTPSMVINAPLPVTDMQPAIALRRRRGNSLSNPLSSPRERPTYSQPPQVVHTTGTAPTSESDGGNRVSQGPLSDAISNKFVRHLLRVLMRKE